MASTNARQTLREFLLRPTMIDQLRERFAYIQGSLTTTINEASRLTGLSEAQLRYAELRGLLAPNRAIDSTPIGLPTRGQRRYTTDDLLNAHLIAVLLDQGYSLTEVATFIQNNSSIIQELLQTSALRLQTATKSADDIQFQRFLLQRIFYYALSLIFEKVAITHAGIIIPVRASDAELNQIDSEGIETADDLVRLGHFVLVWCTPGHPVMTFTTSGNPFEREQNIRLKPFSELLAAELEPAKQLFTDAPRHVFIAYEPQAERELDQADRMLAVRKNRSKESKDSDTSGRTLAQPRVVAGRLLHYAQELSCQRFLLDGQREPGLSDVLLYTAPELVNPALGDALLNRLTETVVALGGRSQGTKNGQRWRFCCVLLPRESAATLKQQELVVHAQSSLGPHRIGVTTTSPKLNGGLTFRAYSSGRITYRPEVIPLDPAISYAEEEWPIRSAIAAPAVDGPGAVQSQPPAVIYITSEEPNAFNDNDFLLIRVMGRLVGELVQTYNSRGHLPNTLTDTLANPEIVDSYFAEFLSDLNFMSDLKKILDLLNPPKNDSKGAESRAAEPKDDALYTNIRTLTLIGLDIDDFSRIQKRQGDQVARMLTREIGSRIQQRMNSSFSHGMPTARLYRAWGDRFYMLVRDEEFDEAVKHAERIRKEISCIYQVDGDGIVSLRSASSAQAQGAGGIDVHVRMVGISLSPDELREQLRRSGDDNATCVASLTRLLDDGLKQANENPDLEQRSLWWDAKNRRYELTSSLLEQPNAV